MAADQNSQAAFLHAIVDNAIIFKYIAMSAHGLALFAKKDARFHVAADLVRQCRRGRLRPEKADHKFDQELSHEDAQCGSCHCN